MIKKSLFLLFTSLLLVAAIGKSDACTNLIVTKGASTDGSIMVSYSADSHLLYGELYHSAPGTHKYDDMLDIHEWDSGKHLGQINQVEKTYLTNGNMNEHQLAISETTFGGRSELYDSTGIMDYGSLIYVTLQRAKTAREAIEVIVDLATNYGYASSGESLTIADRDEVWIMELIGKGYKEARKNVNAKKGIVWVALKVPDGYISAHANHARITQFPLDDPDNCLYAKDVISFAKKKGYFSGNDEDFSFSDAYAPLDFGAMRYCEARVWSFFNMFNDDMGRYLDYAMGHNKNNRMPLWIIPKHKLSPKMVFDAMRDHYDGTPLDMHKDLGAGGEGSPYRWRPMEFEVDGKKYVHERAIATQQTGFWFVAQTRDWLPNFMGGILWFGVDDAATSSLTPIYCSAKSVPECFKVGNGHLLEYSPTAAFWLYNRVAQFAYLRYNVVGAKVKEYADIWENHRLDEILEIDKEAQKILRGGDESGAREYLTRYSVGSAQRMFRAWSELDKYLLVRYIDGNVKKEDADGFVSNGNTLKIPVYPDWPGYSEKWKRAVVQDNGEILRMVE